MARPNRAMLGLSPWVSFVVVLLAGLLVRLVPPQTALGAWCARLLDAPRAPLVVGGLTGLITAWAWGSLRHQPLLHDEAAYMLQAQLFARLHWTAAMPPLPAFFEQMYVLVSPAVASKYPPGTSLWLAPGVLLGLPGLMVILANAASGALVFALARRIADASTALVCWLLWVTSFFYLYYHLSYMSEVPSSLAWLAAWWGILEWRAGRGVRWLCLAAIALGWCAITRPLTGVALALVAIVVVLRDVWGRRAWRDCAAALATGIAVVALIPLWNWRTTGSVQLSPLALYTRTYVPFDRPGWGATEAERPSARLPADQMQTSMAFYSEHQRHSWQAMPATVRRRATMIARDAWFDWRGGLRIFALVGLFALPVAGWIGLGAALMQFLLYLSYAHPPFYTRYYLELGPVLAFITAVGIVRVVRLLVASKRDGAANDRLVIAALVLALAVVLPAARTLGQVRTQVRTDHAYHDAFDAMLSQIPDRAAVVFVRYAPGHNSNLSVVRNAPDLASARVWTVYDRGAENAELLARAPGRVAYLFDEAAGTLSRLDR